jgi:hypothetical protein
MPTEVPFEPLPRRGPARVDEARRLATQRDRLRRRAERCYAEPPASRSESVSRLAVVGLTVTADCPLSDQDLAALAVGAEQAAAQADERGADPAADPAPALYSEPPGAAMSPERRAALYGHTAWGRAVLRGERKRTPADRPPE